MERLDEDGFEDTLTGVFSQGELPDEGINQLIAFLTEQRDQIG